MAEIILDVAPAGHDCDTCLNAASWALTIGAGYRQPSYLCSDCVARLRFAIDPRSMFRAGIAALADAGRELVIRMFASNARRNTQEGE